MQGSCLQHNCTDAAGQNEKCPFLIPSDLYQNMEIYFPFSWILCGSRNKTLGNGSKVYQCSGQCEYLWCALPLSSRTFWKTRALKYGISCSGVSVLGFMGVKENAFLMKGIKRCVAVKIRVCFPECVSSLAVSSLARHPGPMYWMAFVRYSTVCTVLYNCSCTELNLYWIVID